MRFRSVKHGGEPSLGASKLSDHLQELQEIYITSCMKDTFPRNRAIVGVFTYSVRLE